MTKPNKLEYLSLASFSSLVYYLPTRVEHLTGAIISGRLLASLSATKKKGFITMTSTEVQCYKTFFFVYYLQERLEPTRVEHLSGATISIVSLSVTKKKSFIVMTLTEVPCYKTFFFVYYLQERLEPTRVEHLSGATISINS